MRKLLMLVLCAWLALPAWALNEGHGVEGPGWFKQSFLDIREDVAEATRARRKLMLYFYQDGCPYCARFLRETLGVKTIEDRTFRNFDVVAIDLRGAREVTDLAGKAQPENQFAEAMGVKYTPTFLVFDEAGKVILRQSGFPPPRKFSAMLDYVAEGAYRSYPDFDIYLKVRASAGMIRGEGGALMR
ncbi:MAG: thioredoxin fold domain-containing protein [Gammaproteobacteria bacterium]|nr:thioredoxin fold domain-containing protein [Gammaproteobacteria bacterium]MBU1416377.1 thioredoxin fold domain-containing protein [Gammaproteobacteria bacterium]